MRGFVPRGLGGCFFAWVGVSSIGCIIYPDTSGFSI